MITAIILAAGASKRMGQAKLTLAWGETTVLGKIIETIQGAGVKDVAAVTGGAKDEVEKILARYKVRAVWNENFEKSEMLASIQIGLRGLSSRAALIALGDQPQIEKNVALQIIAAWNQVRAGIIVPSYENRRGHPWLIAKEYWNEILDMKTNETMRDFFNRHQTDIYYVNVNTASILQDLDTPEDYLKFKP